MKAIGLVALLGATSVNAAELTLLSGGAVEPGLRPAVAAFEKASGHTVTLTFNSAPQIAARLSAGETWDAVIAPVGVLDAAAKAGRLGSARAAVGSVGIGVAVRADAPVPDIADAAGLERSLRAADSVVYNRASTGIAFEGVLRRLGIAEAVEAKSTRPADGALVMEHLRQGHGREIGFGAVTEILLFRDRGIRFVGPLPASLQVFTTYAAAVPVDSRQPAAAQALMNYLAGDVARALFKEAGVDPSR